MSAQGYYGSDSSQGNSQHNYYSGFDQSQTQDGGYSQNTGTGSSQHQQSNPYGYPESDQTQPYYGQQEPYGQQQQQHHQSYGYHDQQHTQYESQSYNYQSHEQQYAPPAYDHSLSSGLQYSGYQQPPMRDQYSYDGSRQQGYNQYHQAQIPPDPAIAAAKIDPNAPATAEGERGLMGALAGGAIGAYGGHQMGHGIIGGIGGAIAGSKLEDHYKDKKKKEKKHRKHGDGEHRRQRRGSHSSSSSSSSSDSSSDSGSGKHKKHRKHRKDKYAAAGIAGAGGYAGSAGNRDVGHGRGYAGNFSKNVSNITLDRDNDLIALCVDRHGKEKLSSIDLNDYLTNEWGHFRWARGGNAFASAKNVRLVDGGRALEADLADGNNGWNKSRIVLDEMIGNDDGELVFVG